MPLVLSSVSFAYPRARPVLVGLEAVIGDGELVAVTGPSGSGKSTLLQLLGGLVRPQSGSVSAPPMAEIRWVFQTPTSLGRRSALDNVRVGLIGSGWDSAELESRCLDALRAVGLAEQAAQRANTLSGGELQRVQVARALVSHPRLVLADEPTAQLDRAATAAIVEAFAATRSPSSTVVIATHDPTVAAACDRRLALSDGNVHEDR